MEFIVRVEEPKDKNGQTIKIGDYVEHHCKVYRVDGFDVSCDVFGDSDVVRGKVDFLHFKNFGYAESGECIKFVDLSQDVRIRIALDSELTDGEALDEILNIIGYER